MPIRFAHLAALVAALSAPAVQARCPETLDFHVRPLVGDQAVHLCEAYAGRVVLIVNTASKCAFTPQYEGLEKLYDSYRKRGLVVLGFPSNDFGAQEPGDEEAIQGFCRMTYGVQFPMFEKTHAGERNAAPLYRLLAERAGEYPRWNFRKYLLDRDGRLVGSFASQVEPDDARLIRAIEQAL